MEKKIKQFFYEALNGHYNSELYKELNVKEVLDYAIKNNKLNEFKFLVTPQQYDDGSVRIIYDPFSDSIYKELNMYLNQQIPGIEEFVDSLYEIDYDKLFQIKIKDSHAREISGMGHPIKKERDIIYLSEPACLKSMLKLFELNITTWANDTAGCIEDSQELNEEYLRCGINIKYSTLSSENKKIIDKLMQEGFVIPSQDKDNIIFLNVKLNRDETIGEVSNRLLEVVSKLQIQDVYFEQFNEENIRKNILTYYEFRYIRFDTLPYEVLSSELIKYYEQFNPEEFPEKDEIINNIKSNVYSEKSLNDYLRQESDFRRQVLKNIVASIPIDECISQLLDNGYFIDEENKQIFTSELQYQKHQNYLKSKQKENNSNCEISKTTNSNQSK